MEHKVKIVYRNEKLEPVYEKRYGLDEYTEMLKFDLLRLITDVEDIIYECNDGRAKDEWTDSVWLKFCKVKHKILDKAGEISRLPENIYIEEGDHGTDSVGQTSKHSECRDANPSDCCKEHKGLSPSCDNC